jgi:hypothetical protein
VLPTLLSNEKNSFDHDNSYNKGPILHVMASWKAFRISHPLKKIQKIQLQIGILVVCPKSQNSIFGTQVILQEDGVQKDMQILDNQVVNKHVEAKKAMHKEVEKTMLSEGVKDVKEIKRKDKKKEDEDSEEGDAIEEDVEVRMKA